MPDDEFDDSGEPESPSLPEQVAEYMVFAPLGFALEAVRALPELLDRGRGQMNAAQATGRRAFGRYQKWCFEQIHSIQVEAESALRGLGLAKPGDEPPASNLESSEGVDAQNQDPAIGSPGSVVETEPPEVSSGEMLVGPRDAASTASERIATDQLAIPEYDSLSASQVVPRLQSLTADELEHVRVYESSGRGRRTILNKVIQLQSSQ